MRFDEFRDLTSLPSGQLESEFKAEKVLAVLPVSEGGPAATAFLIATPTKLGLATCQPSLGGSCVTRWAPWDAVRFGAQAPKRSRRRRAPLRAAIRVGSRTFHGVLAGALGQIALRDFARAVRSRHEALALRPVA